MNKYLAGYLGAALVMVALDALWLGVIARALYQQAIGHLMAEQPNKWAALVFYALYPAGVVIFALLPQSGDGSAWRTLLMGALFGLFAYATYDLTNLATLRNWPLGIALIDVAWGVAISTAAAAGGRAAMNWAAGG